MTPDDFQTEIARLRNHYGERNYGSETVSIFWKEFGSMSISDFRRIVLEAFATRPQGRPPLRNDFFEIAGSIGINSAARGSWKFIQSDCSTCGGCGWHWIRRADGGVAVCACDSCEAGRNQQRAPKPTITITLKQIRNATYLCAGTANPDKVGVVRK